VEDFEMVDLATNVADKFDQDLFRLLNADAFKGETPIPVLIHCSRESIPQVEELVVSIGGAVRHHLPMFGAVTAWIPLQALPVLASDAKVEALELERQFTLAY
jgi:hypothetical protein